VIDLRYIQAEIDSKNCIITKSICRIKSTDRKSTPSLPAIFAADERKEAKR